MSIKNCKTARNCTLSLALLTFFVCWSGSGHQTPLAFAQTARTSAVPALLDHSSLETAVVQGDWGKVYTTLTMRSLHDQAHPIERWLLGYAALATGQHREATSAFARLESAGDAQAFVTWATSLAQAYPHSAPAWMLQGDAFARTGAFAQALASLTRAGQYDSQNALIRDLRGVVHFLAGEKSAASADLEEALKLDAYCVDAMVNQGLIKLHEGNTAGAAELFTSAIELAPEFALAYNARGVAYSVMEAWEAAGADFAEARRLGAPQALTEGNFKLWERLRAQTGFRKTRWVAELEVRGTAFIAQSTEHRVVDLGGDRTMDAFIVKPTAQTATLAGARSVLRGIIADLRATNGLPEAWQPRLHLDAHGAFSTPSAQRDYAAHMAHETGADSVILLDLSTWYTSPRALAWSQAVDEGAKFLATMSAAITMETTHAPTFTGFPGGAEIFPRLGALIDRGALPTEVTTNLRFSNVVLTGYPFHRLPGGDVAVSEKLLQRLDGGVYNLYTDPGQWSNRLQEHEKVTNIRVRDLQGRTIAHADWTHPLIGDRPSPVPEVGGYALRGVTPSTVQRLADQRSAGEVPLYSVAATQPVPMATAMASMTERGLRTGDRVLIGSLDAERTAAMRNTLQQWPTEVLATVDPRQLQAIAKDKGFTRILLIDSGAIPQATALAQGEQPRAFATLPEIRPFRETLSRSLQAAKVFEHVTGMKILSDPAKHALTGAGAVTEDLITSRNGQFHPLTSQTLEELGKVGLSAMQKKVGLAGFDGVGDMVGALASNMGRGAGVPNINEVTRFLDGFNKSLWAMTGYVISRNPEVAREVATTADFAVYALRGATAGVFQDMAIGPVQQQAIAQWQTHVERARASGVPAKTFTAMYTHEGLRELRMPVAKVQELDNLALWSNHVTERRPSTASQPSTRLAAEALSTPIPTRRETLEQPNPLYGSGGTGAPPPSPLSAVKSPDYRLPARSVTPVGGVDMHTDVVQKAQVDFSAMLGTRRAPEVDAVAMPASLYAPFLIFAAREPQGQ
jgi:tetratricopeptide (TPR) repeat protein